MILCMTMVRIFAYLFLSVFCFHFVMVHQSGGKERIFGGDTYLMRGCGQIPIIDGVMTAGGSQLNELDALSLSGFICCSGKIGNGWSRVCDVGEECIVRDCHFSCRPHRCSAVQNGTIRVRLAGQSILSIVI
jgi:hypothetical protein